MELSKEKRTETFLKGFWSGLGWMVGATFGFAIFLFLMSLLLKLLGGLPIIGIFFANLVEATNVALEMKKNFGR